MYFGGHIASAYWIIKHGNPVLRLSHLGASFFLLVVGNNICCRAVSRLAKLEGIDELVKGDGLVAVPTLELRLLGADQRSLSEKWMTVDYSCRFDASVPPYAKHHVHVAPDMRRQGQ